MQSVFAKFAEGNEFAGLIYVRGGVGDGRSTVANNFRLSRIGTNLHNY
jgi:hypothetical protein